MRYLGIFLLIGFIGLALFGVLSMHVGTHDHESGCIAAAAQGVDCSKQSNLFDDLTFHLNAYQGFSLAALGENNANALLFFFASLLLFGVALFSPLLFRLPRLAPYRYRFLGSFYPPHKQEFIQWLSLHENSPAAF